MAVKQKKTSGTKKQKAGGLASLAEVSREIRRAVDTGKVAFGKKQGEKSVLKGGAELIIISSNAPQMVRERMKQLSQVTSVPVLEYSGTGLELGSACGKPFTVSVMVVQKTGKSRILSAAK